jgi:hypothetical protein
VRGAPAHKYFSIVQIPQHMISVATIVFNQGKSSTSPSFATGQYDMLWKNLQMG